MSVIPYLSQGQGVEIDPLTGLPKKKKAQPGVDPSLAAQSQALNQQYGLGAFAPATAGGGAARDPQKSAQGGMPDYKALIEAALGPMAAQFGADSAADLKTRNDQLIRSLGQFGQEFDLGSANAAFGEGFVGESGLAGLLPQANELARQTTGAGMSFKARSEKAHKDSVRQIRNSLASRGLLRSGETGHQLQEAQTAFDTGQYDARMQVQDFMSAVNQGYANAQRQRQMQMSAAQREEAARQAQLNPGIAASYGTPGGPRILPEFTGAPQASAALDPYAAIKAQFPGSRDRYGFAGESDAIRTEGSTPEADAAAAARRRLARG